MTCRPLWGMEATDFQHQAKDTWVTVFSYMLAEAVAFSPNNLQDALMIIFRMMELRQGETLVWFFADIVSMDTMVLITNNDCQKCHFFNRHGEAVCSISDFLIYFPGARLVASGIYPTHVDPYAAMRSVYNVL